MNYKMFSPRYLALWLGLQHMSYDAVEARIQHSVNLVATAYELLLLFSFLLTLSDYFRAEKMSMWPASSVMS